MKKFQNLILGLGGYFTSGSPESQEAFNALSPFTNTAVESLIKWFDGRRFPYGIRLIKLREAFIGAGFNFVENESMPEALKKLCFLLAHDYVNIKTDYSKFGFTSPDGMTAPLATERKIGQGKIDFIATAISQIYSDADIRLMMEKDRAKFSCLTRFRGDTPAVASAITPEEVQQEIKAIETFMNLAKPRIESFMNGGVAGREKFRELFQGNSLLKTSNNIFEFSKQVEGLCSEKALEKYKINKENL